MKTTRFVGILLVILFVMAPCISADAQETIGVVRNTTGEATITRGDQVRPAVSTNDFMESSLRKWSSTWGD